MACRDEKRGEEALEEVIDISKSQQVALEICELASFESILAFTTRIKDNYDSLDVLINNAGLIYFTDLQLTKKYSAFKAYSQSKLANLLFAKAMATRLSGSNVTINAVHPGAVGTNLGINRETGFGKKLMKLLGYFFLTPEEGAKTTVYLADSPEVTGKSGGYYYKQKEASIAKIAQNDRVVERFYQLSEQLVKEKRLS